MRKEEILRKHFKVEFGHEGHGKFMQYILAAMDEYAKQEVKKCSIPAVVGRSEQLKCEHKGRRTATELVEYCEDCKKILYHP